MKRIVAYVAPFTEEHDPHGAAQNGVPVAVSETELHDDVLPAVAGAVRLEVIVSDSQARKFLAELLEQSSGDQDGAAIEAIVQKELDVAGPDAQDLFDRIVVGVERRLISQVYTACDRIKTHTATRLGINRNTLLKKLRQFDLLHE